jgi:opacity protein-like surface antigen
MKGFPKSLFKPFKYEMYGGSFLMRKVLLLATLIALCASVIYAQDRSRPEFFAGYSFETMDSGIKNSDFLGTGITSTTLEQRYKLNGFNVSGTGYFTKRFGITGDFSAGFERRIDDFGIVQTNAKFSVYNVTAGPQVKFFSNRRVAPFVHALFGLARRSLKETVEVGVSAPITFAEDSTTSFAMNLGGGIDVRLNDRIDVRVIQVDYNPIFLKSRTVEDVVFPSRTAHGLRFSIGLVFK